MTTITKVPKMPPRVDKALAVGPINFNPPRIMNNGIKISSEIVINQEETTGFEYLTNALEEDVHRIMKAPLSGCQDNTNAVLSLSYSAII